MLHQAVLRTLAMQEVAIEMGKVHQSGLRTFVMQLPKANDGRVCVYMCCCIRPG
jgi:hypothetical protein